jgi:hypothetical protein
MVKPHLEQVYAQSLAARTAAQSFVKADRVRLRLGVMCTIAPDKLIGWPMQLSHEARAPLASPWRDLPFLGRRAGRGSTLPLERLLALRPDLIIDAGTVDASCRSTARRVFEQTRIPDALIDGRLPESPHQLREAGRLLGVGPRASAWPSAPSRRWWSAQACAGCSRACTASPSGPTGSSTPRNSIACCTASRRS